MEIRGNRIISHEKARISRKEKGGMMRKAKEYAGGQDIPKNIVVLVMFIAIIVSVTGTWMVLDAVSNTGTTTVNTITAKESIALDIEYAQEKNTTKLIENE